MSDTKPKTPARSARSKTPVFDALIMEAQRSRPEHLIDIDDLAARRGVTEQERAEAVARLQALDREDAAADAAECLPRRTAQKKRGIQPRPPSEQN